SDRNRRASRARALRASGGASSRRRLLACRDGRARRARRAATARTRRDPRGVVEAAARADESAAPEQRLMLPDPRVLFLIAIEPVHAAHEQPGSAARAEPRVDVVETGRARPDREEMHQPLHEPSKEALVVERRLAIRLLLG